MENITNIKHRIINDRYYFDFEDYCKTNNIYDTLRCWDTIPESEKILFGSDPKIYYISYKILSNLEILKSLFGDN